MFQSMVQVLGLRVSSPAASSVAGAASSAVWLRIWGSGFRVRVLGFRVWGLGLRIQSLGFRVEGSEFGV